MATNVHMEALSPTMEEGQLVRWLKQEGDAISEGDVLAEIETDKATMELVARGSGVLQGITLKEGATAPVGQVIAVIAAEGEQVDAAPAAGEGEPAKDTPSQAEPAAQAASGGAGGESSDRPEGRERQPPAGAGKGSAAKAESAEPKEARHGADAQRGAGSQAPGTDSNGRVKASPLARRLAEESGVDLAAVAGSGPGGRVTKRDIEAAVNEGGATGAAAGAAPAARAADAPSMHGERGAEEIPVTQMRKTIAKRLAQSIGPIPTFYLTIEADMTRLLELRARVNAALSEDGIKTSINDFIIRAVAAALAAHPDVNASWGENVIVRHRRVDIGVAVAVEDGLMTPIIRDADRKRVRDIAGEVKELAGRAREKKLKPEEYTGATFSISNLGMFGIVEFTAIINPPEAGILAVGAVEEKPVAMNGEVKVRPRMRMTMSCDHRVVDGATGAKFLQTVQQLIEDPLMMIA
ncbi:MAG: pyruvate dehydrogenase complex dihydrolipoamide acetyltransferase [Gemmatimonadota bacterium]